MKLTSLRGGGRLLRVAICGLVAATAIPAAASADGAQTFSVPFATTVMNTCLPTPEAVLVTGTQHVTFDASTGRQFMTFQGTATAPVTGAKYTFDETQHVYVGDGPGDTVFELYDYRRAMRQGDFSTPLGGDDFFVKIFIQIPPGGRPPEMTFAGCR